MKLRLVAIVWLARSMMAFAIPCESTDCPCPEGRSPCTECYNVAYSGFDCLRSCSTNCVDFTNDPNNCGSCNKAVSLQNSSLTSSAIDPLHEESGELTGAVYSPLSVSFRNMHQQRMRRRQNVQGKRYRIWIF